MSETLRGIVAAGHRATAEAGREVLEEGGNAFDAAVAAGFAACVAEPTLASLGGGGFLLARTAGGSESLYDFFAHTPIAKRPGGLDFFPVECDFGEVVQTFHVGMASIATPGVVKGLFRIHRDLCTASVARLTAPAVRLAREGITVDPVRTFTQKLLRPILVAMPESARLFAGEDTAPGRRWRNPELAGVLEALAAEGEDLFYQGELAADLAEACAAGGHLTVEDLGRYQVIRRGPLGWRYRGHRLAGNPPPSTGCLLIAFALSLLEDRDVGGFGSRAHLRSLFHAMALTDQARAAAGRARALRGGQAMLRSPFLEPYRRSLREHLQRARGTTHLSVADRDGNVASLSLSNGECSGFVLPGTGIMLNNMLGEDDLHPDGLGRWGEDRRLASMMAPTLVERPDGRLAALGSGGSNRLRTAILQVLVNLLAFDRPLQEAVSSPRLHYERGRLDVEPGWPDAAVEALAAEAGESRVWRRPNLFFGGVHAVELDPRRGAMRGAGDPRRGGVVLEAG